MIDIEVPITWIADHTGLERLHDLGDVLHEQTTDIARNRYFWAIHPGEPIVLCRDVASNDVIEWHKPDGNNVWIIAWLREMTKLVTRKAMH